MRLFLSSYRFSNQPERMLEIIKGKKVAVIANAMDFLPKEIRADKVEYEEAQLRALGLEPEELDLRKYFGKSKELEEKANEYDYFWVRGGNVFILRKAYKYSGFDNIITNLIQQDKVAYGGYSAGCCILAPSLDGVEIVDKADIAVEGYNVEIIWDGLGIINYAFAPHYRSDHPESVDIEKMVKYYEKNKILYKTLHDGEAVLINGDKEEMIR